MFAHWVHCRQCIPRCKRGQLRAPIEIECISSDDSGIQALLCEACESGINFFFVAGVLYLDLQCQRARSRLYVVQFRFQIRIAGFASKPTALAFGTSSRSTSSRLAPSAVTKKLTPVTLPP